MAETKTARTRAAKPAAASAAIPEEMFQVPNMEVPTVVREFAEKSIETAKENYARMKSAAEDATDMLEDSYESSRQGMLEIHMKAIDAAKTSTDAAFAFVKDMMAVKSMAEAVELQTAFAHQQFDSVVAQSKEMQELVSKVATDAAQPAKDAFQKSMKDLKAA
ncbi:MAG: phasin [Pseudomonadota bacterium]